MLAVVNFFGEDVTHIVLAGNIGDADRFVSDSLAYCVFSVFNVLHGLVCHVERPQNTYAVGVEGIRGARSVA